MNKFLTRHAPPGIELRQEVNFFILGQVLSFLFSLGFFAKYIKARAALFEWSGGKRHLIEGVVIADFHDLTHIYFIGFGLVALSMIGLLVYHYTYYRQGSMSIYLMKRLPDPRERHRRALALPCLAILVTAGTALITMLLYFAVYLLATPKVCLPDGVWQQLWRIN